MAKIKDGATHVEASDGFRNVVVLKVTSETRTQIICAVTEKDRERRFMKNSGREVRGYLGRGWAWTAKPEQVAKALADEAAAAACAECGGATVEFRGSGSDLQHKVCSRWLYPGHLAPAEVAARIARETSAHAPKSGRFA